MHDMTVRDKLEPFMDDGMATLYQGDCLDVLRRLPDESVHCCVTSPPYFGLRDYGTAEWQGGDAACDHTIVSPDADNKAVFAERVTRGERDKCLKCSAVRIDAQIGLERSPQLFIAKMVEVFEEVRRVLRSDGVLFLNLGDSYWGGKGQSGGASPERQDERHESGASLNKSYQQLTGAKITRPTDMKSDIFKPKDQMLIPHRVAIALQDAGWWVRSDMPWVKRSAMPESVTDRPAKALEYVFMLTKSKDCYFDMGAVRVRMAESSIGRMERGVSENHKNIEGAPGQTPHSMNKPRENVRNQPDSWKGSSFSSGKTAEHQLGRAQKDRDRSLPSNRNGITGSLDTPKIRKSGNKAKSWGENETPNRSEATGSIERQSGIPWEGTGRSFRNSDLWYSSIREPHGLVGIGNDLVGLDVNPSGFKEAHFATYPPKLIEPLIKAGTSEKGCCADCGSPYERMTEKQLTETRSVATAGPVGDHGFMGGNRRDEPNKITTTGWQKTCKCETDEIMPCTVLDPFGGAGTTLLVAKRLGRKSVGIELNPEYCKMIERRLENWHKPSPPKAVDDSFVGTLFEGIDQEVAA